MPTEYSTLELNYSYKKVEYQEYEIKYSYNLIAYQTAEYNIVYSYDNSSDFSNTPYLGHWTYHTNLTTNALPSWHAGRYSMTGNYKKLINSFAINMESNQNYFKEIRSSLYIDTTPLDEPYEFHYCRHGLEFFDVSDRNLNNIVYNSDFTIPRRAVESLPCGWAFNKSESGSASLDSFCFSADNSLKISTNSGEYLNASQTYSIKFPEKQDICFSAMVNVPNHSGHVDLNASGNANLTLEALYVDGSVERSTVNIPLSTTEESILEDNTTGQISYWRRIHTNLNLSKPSNSIKVYINSNYSNATSDAMFYIDCLQLEDGDTPSPWTHSQYDSYHWLYSSPEYIFSERYLYSNNTSQYTQSAIVLNSNTSFIDIRPKTKIHYTQNSDQFFYASIPTKLTSVSSTTETGFTINRKGIVVDTVDTNVQSAEYYVLDSDRSKIRRRSFEFKDSYGEFKIAEKDYFGTFLDRETYTVLTDHYATGGYSYDLNIKAITIESDYIVAFCKETIGSEVYYTFKYIKPEAQIDTDYFECVQDYKVPDSIRDIFTGSVETGSVEFNSIGKVEGEKNKYIIGTNSGDKYAAVFAFDYYVVEDQGAFLTREKYDQICIT